jgi:hypothetical protein
MYVLQQSRLIIATAFVGAVYFSVSSSMQTNDANAMDRGFLELNSAETNTNVNSITERVVALSERVHQSDLPDSALSCHGFVQRYSNAGCYTDVEPFLEGLLTSSGSNCSAVLLSAATILVDGDRKIMSSFIAAPASGPAPLTVLFGASELNANSGYLINFGDDTSQRLALNQPPCAFGTDCSNRYSATASHTYESTGTFTAKLQTTCREQGPCNIAGVLLGTVTVTVTQLRP